MPYRRPSEHRRRLNRIQSLCTELTNTIETSRHQRETLLKLAREATNLAESVADPDPDEDTEQSKRR